MSKTLILTRSPLVDGSNPFLATNIRNRKPAVAQCKDALMPDLSSYVNTQQASQLLHVHIETIRQMLRDGKLEGIKISSQAWIVSKKSIERYLKETSGMDKHDPRRANL